MTIPTSQFSQSATLPTNPLKLHRRPTSPADERRLQYLMQVSKGPSMPSPEVIDLERFRSTLRSADDDRCSNMSIDKWVKFWSKKTIKYHLPPPRKEKKTVRPRSTHNPLGDITAHKRWSIAEETLFEKLCIEGNLKEEVYLAAYLAC
ncbi:UNVERIFIED_CONTAM: hypothetical protein Sradi_3162300 [Sesamum radiatum]|uniref:Uncharacterized protein n=1 Tax=Sesamum radiatum TaxID=300843 RepID=A0AAW2RF03_SESRA